MSLKQKKLEKDPTYAPKVVMWAIIDSEDPDTPITFTATRHDAIIALDQYLYLKHYTHFRLWCGIHDREVDHGASWRDYAQTVINDESVEGADAPYQIVKIDYDPNVIASLLRSYNHCTPLGCPFDTDEELSDYSTYFAAKTERVERGEDKYTPLEEALNLLFEDLEKENCNECDDATCTHNPSFTPDEENNQA